MQCQRFSVAVICVLCRRNTWMPRHFSSKDGHLNRKIPPKPTWKPIDRSKFPKRVVDDATIELIERLSLVDFNNKAGVDRLMDAIALADTLREVDTTNVEPMDSVLEDRALELREDVVTDGDCKNDVMKNAALTFEDYFVAPPGNIPLETKPASRYTDADNTDRDNR